VRFEPRFSAVLPILLSLRKAAVVLRKVLAEGVRFDCGQYGSFAVFAVYLRCSAVIEPRLERSKWERDITAARLYESLPRLLRTNFDTLVRRDCLRSLALGTSEVRGVRNAKMRFIPNLQ